MIKILKSKIYRELQWKADMFDEVFANDWQTITKDNLEKLPKRCKKCRKKITPYNMKYRFSVAPGLGINVFAEHECGEEYNISDYENW